MDTLNTEVSYYKNCRDTAQPVTVNLQTYLRSEKHRAEVERIRQTADAAERKRLKNALPGITPSGIFHTRNEAGLIRHSGVIAGDIDFKDNPFNPASIKKALANIKEIAYAGLSASGAGLWFLMPIAYPERHREHYAALVAYFTELSIRLDPAPANVASFRYYSFDPQAYYNAAATLFTRTMEPCRPASAPRPVNRTAAPRSANYRDEAAKLESVVSQIEANGADITGNYLTWFSLLASLATLGEAGRDYAHRVSQFYRAKKGYRRQETDKQFTACLRMKRNAYTLGTFFDLARQYGFNYKEAHPILK